MVRKDSSVDYGVILSRFFWREHPALLASLSLLIGSASVLTWPFPWNILFPFLWAAYLFALKKWACIPLLFAMAAYSYFLYGDMPASHKTQGVFSISTLQPHQSPFAKGYVYKGTLTTQSGKIPCDIYAHNKKLANCDYLLQGSLEKRGPFQYAFKPECWTPIENTWSLAELRYELKERYRAFLAKKCRSPRAANFLAALTTGDVDDRLLKYQFGRLGLQHLLAISGFHFGVLIAFASFALSLLLPRPAKYALLLFALTAYYLFVGPFPAVQRSWIAALAFLGGNLIRRKVSGLNLLGLALGVEILLNPLIVSNLGFQFSFASCFGILLFHAPIKEALFSKRSFQETKTWPLFSKQANLISRFLSNSLALNFAVNAAIFPILLCHFHTFPLLSLLYNLFFPFAVGIALSILLLALCLHLLVPILAAPFFFIASWSTDTLLDLAAYPPAILDYPLLVSAFPFWAVPFYLFLIASFAIHQQMDLRQFGK